MVTSGENVMTPVAVAVGRGKNLVVAGLSEPPTQLGISRPVEWPPRTLARLESTLSTAIKGD